MRKCLTALAAGIALVVAAVATPTAADARRAWRAGVGTVAVAKPYYYPGPTPGYYYLYPINQAYYWPVPVYYRYPTPGPYFGCWRYGIFVC